MAKIANWMGHSGAEPGAHGILQEDDVTRQARAWSVAYMRACGHTVITDNDNMSLVQRINASNGVDAIIEWHANLLGNGKAYGTEAWYSQYDSGRGIKAAQAISAAATKFGFTNRGAKNSKTNRYGRLGILDDPTPTAVLVELLFLDNQGDVNRWKTNGKAFVEGLTAAFLASLGYKSTPNGAVPNTPTTPSVAKPATVAQPTYALRALNAGWLSNVVGKNDINSDGYAGVPYQKHDYLTVSVPGGCQYQVHILGGGWLPMVSGSNKSDLVNGAAGIGGKIIDGIRIKGNKYSVHYRVQTTKRSGWLDTVTNLSDYAGWYGEPIDRLQVWI